MARKPKIPDTPIERAATALCWNEFCWPPGREPTFSGTPEGYWRDITENTREYFRAAAKLAVETALGAALSGPVRKEKK